MSTATEKISYSRTSYSVTVDSFKHKMNTWENGKRVVLNEFIVDGTNFRLALYPNGKDEERDKHVSLFIRNCSDVDIDILFDVNMGRKVEKTDVNFSIKAGGGRGYPQFYDHDDENRWDNEDEQYGSDDSDFEITLTVKNLWKHVNGGNSNSRSVQFSSFETRVEKELESLGDSVKRLLSKTNIPYPECPICFENMTLATRIMQCYLGHPMCEVCHDKLETKICPTCKTGMIGRNHGMESYLRTLFSDQNAN